MNFYSFLLLCSIVGMHLDYLAFNTVGHVFYLIYNYGLFHLLFFPYTFYTGFKPIDLLIVDVKADVLKDNNIIKPERSPYKKTN